MQNCANPDNNISLTPKNPAILKKDVISCRNWHSFQGLSPALPLKITPSGRGNVPVARKRIAPNPKPHKRQNQTIRKHSTIPQSNFHSSKSLSPEVPDVLKQASISRLTGCFRSLLKAPQIPSFRRRRLFYLKPSAFFVCLLNFSAFGII